MKAIVCKKYGPPEVLELREVAKPVPSDNEVLIQIHAAAVNAGDWHLMRGKPYLVRLMFGPFRPKFPILGMDIAGRVVAVGKNIKQFRPGDEVFGDLTNCGFGAFAEYVCATENELVPKPSNITFEEAAAVPVAAVTALQGLGGRSVSFSGKKVLINGASGGVGTFAVQLAKLFGAEVTAVCSTRKLAYSLGIGADHVIDYTKVDFTKNGEKYDFILAANGFHSLSAYKRALSDKGAYVMIGGTNAQLFQAMALGPLMGKKGGKTFGACLVKPNQADLLFMKGLLEHGKIKPVIDKRYPLSEVPEAIKYVESGQPKGKVIITT